ncbi:putative amidoligase enzyme-domain-containing protein [Echria macrotheca]|uniref:Amidoligase enzyme-domain-containing protein n=1 Tax=Echria macrotheca TaxID=438768 RepID=A0AAJ0F5F0_9PEZI|nr:putative amidoligase enzyme-domain-containing protein [Echria macrotheca]
MSPNTLRFGVEIELLLGSRKKTYPNWKTLAKDVSKRLAKAGVANHVNDTNDKSPDNYREWSVVPEVTIPSQPAKNLWGIELVSPVYLVSSYWAADLDAVFEALRSGGFQIVPSPHCSTHVHISGHPQPLAAAGLAALAKAALYYESALDLLVPDARRGSVAYWCQSNRASPRIAGYSLAECLAQLDDASTGSARDVVECVNMFPASSAYGRAHGKQKDFIRGKVYKWDLSGMVPGGSGSDKNVKGTVEFRQPAGSVSADEASAWVTLAAAFVAGAMVVGPSLGGVGEQGASAEELWALLTTGGEVLGWESLGGVEVLFARGG